MKGAVVRCIETGTLPEAAACVSHECHDDALDQPCFHGDQHPDDAVLLARGGTSSPPEPA